MKFHPGTSTEAALQHLTQAGATLQESVPQINAYIASAGSADLAAVLAALRSNPAVEYAEPDSQGEGLFTPSDPFFATEQYAPQIMNVDLAWDVIRGDPNIIVAVIDSGVDFNHPDFAATSWWTNSGEIPANGIDDDGNGYVDDIHGYDFVAGTTGDGDPSDDSGHGTHVTGSIAASLNNGVGVAGLVSNSRILVLKVLNFANGCSFINVAKAIIYAADQGARIINLSLGGNLAYLPLEDAVNYAWDHGALLVAAAGNSGPDDHFYPAAYPNVMAVSSTNSRDTLSIVSNYGDFVDVSAPGEYIYSTYWDPDSGHGYWDGTGTSAAAANASGVAALTLARNPALTNVELRQLLESSADDLGPPGKDPYFGYGRLNAYQAVLMAGATLNTPPWVTITTPVNGALFAAGPLISFTGTAGDAEDGGISSQIAWRSNVDGPLGTGPSVAAALSAGSHLITATVTDRGGFSASASRQIMVKPLVEVTPTPVSTGALDGWVLESGENTSVGGSLSATVNSTTGLLVGDDKNNKQYKSIVSFDTSSIPANAIIVSARLRLQRGAVSGTSPFDDTYGYGALWADIRTGGFNDNPALELADFQAPATAEKVASLSNATANGTWSEGDLNSAGLAAINRTGVTQLRLYFNLDDNNDRSIDYLGYYPGEYATAASRPQLVVGYIVNDLPAVTISAPADGASFLEGSAIQFTGSASDTENGNLTNALTWTSNLSGPIGTGGSFSRPLPLGIHTITATAVDKGGAVGSKTITIRVRNNLPTVVITAPASGAAVVAGTMITFSGWADDLQDGSLTTAIIWASSRDGILGSGGSISRMLTVGTHTMTASVTDRQNNTSTASITVTVTPMTATTTLISTGAQDGWVLESGENTSIGGTLNATANSTTGLLVGDDKNNKQYKSIVSFDTLAIPASAIIVSARLRLQRGAVSGTSPFDDTYGYGDLWADIRTDGFNNNPALELADFQAPATAEKVASLSNATANGAWSEGELNSAGLTAINRAGVTQLRLYFNLDDNNDKGADYLGYYPGEYATAGSQPQLVVSYQVNSAPVVSIDTLPSGIDFPEGSLIGFVGFAFDPEDGDRTGTLQWISSRDGSIGTGGLFSKVLSLGTHTITAIATDSQGGTGSATLTVRVRNSVPSVEITAPADGASYTTSQTIDFSGWADDLEQGNLTSAIVWTSNLSGQIGTGGAFSRTLPEGVHTITATITDNQNYTSTDSITVTVTNPPVTVTLNSVGTYDGWVLESGETTNVGGSIKSNDTSSKGLLIGDSKNNYQYKSIVSFDTSQIPANATIESVKLRIQRGTVSGTSPFDTHGALCADIRKGGFNGNVALEKADFEAVATATNVVTHLENNVQVNGLSNATATNAWSEGDLNAAGQGAINKGDGGVTQLRLYFNLDDNNDAGDDYLGYYPGDYATAASRPQLVVTYRQ